LLSIEGFALDEQVAKLALVEVLILAAVVELDLCALLDAFLELVGEHLLVRALDVATRGVHYMVTQLGRLRTHLWLRAANTILLGRLRAAK
jgi:hypothetical protein